MPSVKNENLSLPANPCQTCRGCCAFEEEDRYFATLFTDQELAVLKARGMHGDFFVPYRGSSTVFQINLIRSVARPRMYVCPYLDETTHLCSIYDDRPFDCRFWPFIFMKDTSKKQVLWACFEKRMCDITNAQTEGEFRKRVKDKFAEYSGALDAESYLARYPELAWDCEPATFVIKEMPLAK
jgi:Fe-S-cluster containining protein